jgi:hypothetical protein
VHIDTPPSFDTQTVYILVILQGGVCGYNWPGIVNAHISARLDFLGRVKHDIPYATDPAVEERGERAVFPCVRCTLCLQAVSYREGRVAEACNMFFVWEALRPLCAGIPCYVIPDGERSLPATPYMNHSI